MTTFADGPAQGKTLMLKRAPYFLRVVVDEAGKVDALDQPEDSPRPGETCYVYTCRGVLGSTSVRKTGGRGGIYPIADYMLSKTQPDAITMRQNARWVEWCERNRPSWMKLT